MPAWNTTSEQVGPCYAFLLEDVCGEQGGTGAQGWETWERGAQAGAQGRL